MTTKVWNVGDRVTPIQGYDKGIPCTVRWAGRDRVTVVTDGKYEEGGDRILLTHPNNLRRFRRPL